MRAIWAMSVLAVGCTGLATGVIDEKVDAGAGTGGSMTGGGTSTAGGSAGGSVSSGGAAGGAAGGQVLGGGSAVDAGTGGGAFDPCSAVRCSANARCVLNPTRCECSPGFVSDAGTCEPGDPGVPALRTQAQVCAAYAESQRSRVIGQDFTRGSSMCDPGTLAREAIDDALARLNFHRWLAGLGPVRDEASQNVIAQACSVVSAWNPAGAQAHFPPMTATCWTSAGAQGAGSSNIAWGSSSAPDAIDQWMIDYGNDTTFGHRRWFLSPPLDGVGIGFYRGGNNYGSASCAAVFGGGNQGPSPAWFSFPPAGFSPTSITRWTWSVHGDIPQNAPTATVIRASDGMSLGVRVEVMQGGYGRLNAVTLVRQGWDPAAGQTYRVVLDGTGGPRREWDVKPVDCP